MKEGRDMTFEEIIESATVPYSAVLKEFDWRGSLVQSRQLNFTMQKQIASNWCWAATSASTSLFYCAHSTWQQCTIVNAELGRNDACASPTPSGANKVWYLERALQRTGNYLSINDGPAPFSRIRSEIDAGRPLGARIEWSGGGGHFVVIYGYSIWGGRWFVDIDDPIYGKSQLTWADFTARYRGSGRWTHYYRTKSSQKSRWPDVELPQNMLAKVREARQRMLLTSISDPDHLLQDEQVGAPDESRFGLTQPICHLGLDQLLADDAFHPDHVGLRTYEFVGGTPVAYFDVDDTNDASLPAASRSQVHLDAFKSAVESALPQIEAAEGRADVRALQVPALNFEALWVGDGEASVVIPLHGVDRLVPGQTFPLDEALRVLREAARPLADMDDTMGA